MEFIVNEYPCLLLEAAELVYALVNQIPTEKMTCDMPYAIPAEEMERIRRTACEGLNPGDKELRFYFQGVTLPGQEERLSCLACTLLYCRMCLIQDPDQMIEALQQSWAEEQSSPFQITGISAFSLSFNVSEDYTTLSQQVGRLPIPHAYQLDLVEGLANYDRHTRRLGEILTPVIRRLQPLLIPWVERAAPRRKEWRAFLSEASAESTLLRKSKMTGNTLKRVNMTMRYVFPMAGPGEYHLLSGEVIYHMGIALPPGKDDPDSKSKLTENDYTILRILSSPDRFAIFRSMRKEPKTMQELTVELGLNSGTVFRIVNSMYNAGILKAELVLGRNCYSIDRSALRKVTDRLFTALEED